MLDCLHEDLNRIRTKPYLSIEEQNVNKESDFQASQRWWNNHLQRENSIIVDLFHGQLKTKTSCPECKRDCLNYDTFMYLSLPIPSEMLRLNIKIFNFNTRTNEDGKIFSISSKTIYISETITAGEVLTKFAETEECSEMILVNSSNKSFKRVVFPRENLLSLISKENELVVYRLEDKIQNKKQVNKISFYYNLVQFFEEKNFFSSNKCVDILDYPYVVLLSSDQNLFDLYEKIYSQNKNYLNPIKKETFLELYSRINLYIINTLPEISGFLSTSKGICEFCHDKCNYCILNINISSGTNKNLYSDFNNLYSNNISFNSKLNENTKISELMSGVSVKRGNLAFYLNLKDYNYDIMTKSFPKPYLNEFKSQIIKSNDISIYDCLELFRTEEKLEKDNTWYCNNCKKHQEATVKMQIYKPPYYLIIHLKRFKIKSGKPIIGFMSNKKNDTFITYPTDLDLKDHIIGDYNTKYELIGVNQHHGSISSGHYTAICKNNGVWYEFDDDTVSKSSNKDIVTSSAYLLFYKMK